MKSTLSGLNILLYTSPDMARRGNTRRFVHAEETLRVRKVPDSQSQKAMNTFVHCQINQLPRKEPPLSEYRYCQVFRFVYCGYWAWEGHANLRFPWSRNRNLGLLSLPLASTFILRDPMLIGRKFIDVFCPSRRRSRSRW